MSIQCKSCGNFVDDNVRFCRYCGTPVEQQPMGFDPYAQQVQQQATQGYDPNAYNQQAQQQATQGYDPNMYGQQQQGYDPNMYNQQQGFNNQYGQPQGYGQQGGSFQQNIYIDPNMNQQTPALSGSRFDGSVFDTFCITLGAALLTSFTFGIAFPWALCMMWNFIVSHVIIDGKRLSFDGNGGQLLGNWIKWFILTCVTLGIYGFWVTPKLCNWVAKHTHFRN